MKIPVVYVDEMNAPEHPASMSAAKPRLVVDSWLNAFPESISVKSFAPLSRGEIAIAHSRAYVDGVLDCTKPNGFGTYSPEVSASLPYTNGSLVSAAALAVKNRRVACSPSSGFHHAGFNLGAGFCSFNGLVIAAMMLREAGLVNKVTILDLDWHNGDGTDQLIHHLGLGGWLRNVEPERYRLYRASARDAMEWTDLVIYQAGADAHITDPMGAYGAGLTTEEMLERDRFVFKRARDLGVPIVWNLAGGYSNDIVVDLHNQTMAACIETYVDLP
jgi:acetoin utilization deacetylase AcuC-like enzyme